MRKLGVAVVAIVVTSTSPPARADDATVAAPHPEPRLGLDLRLAVPDGLGVVATMTPSPRVTVGVGLATLLGTIAITPEATWRIRPAARCTPALTAKLSTIVFTPLMDGAVNRELERIYGNQVTVDMAGQAMELAQGLAGVDCALASAHVIARAGYGWQLGPSFGPSGDDGDLTLRNWHGPSLDLGLRWSLR